jgi:hypothetical protein
VPYHVHVEDADRAYIAAMPLSPQAIQRVEDFLATTIAGIPDAFRNDPANRPSGPSAPYFRAQQIILDVWGDGKVHVVDYIVNDSAAAHGVLILVHIAHY